MARTHARGGPNVVAIDSGVGLANATMQLRLVAVRLFYDHLVEEGLRETNPVGRGRYTPGRGFAGHRERGLIPRFTKLPWIPSDEQWRICLRLSATWCSGPGVTESRSRMLGRATVPPLSTADKRTSYCGASASHNEIVTLGPAQHEPATFSARPSSR